MKGCGRAMHSFRTISPGELTDLWRKHRGTLQWTCPFVLPPWLNAWWSVFGRDAQPLIAVVRQGEAVAGVAPLMVQSGTVRFLGDPEICDYFDCIVAEDMERFFFTTLLENLSAQGFKDLDLGPVRPDTAVRRFFSNGEPFPGTECSTSPGGDVLELGLPAGWSEFLGVLSGKERHELRRKMRRLQRAGSIRFRRMDDVGQLPEALETFLRLFTASREDKAEFMTAHMASFFRSLAFALAGEGMLRLFVLDLDEQPVASVFCFDYLGTRYLYNNGYDVAYRELSVGLISKVLSLEAAIDEGLDTYSFLKGSEPYKRRLGGREIPLTRCRVALS